MSARLRMLLPLLAAAKGVGPASAILRGDFKLIRCYETGARRPYNLADDPGERND